MSRFFGTAAAQHEETCLHDSFIGSPWRQALLTAAAVTKYESIHVQSDWYREASHVSVQFLRSCAVELKEGEGPVCVPRGRIETILPGTAAAYSSCTLLCDALSGHDSPEARNKGIISKTSCQRGSFII